jgi:hypothetical protein
VEVQILSGELESPERRGFPGCGGPSRDLGKLAVLTWLRGQPRAHSIGGKPTPNRRLTSLGEKVWS